MNSFIDNNIIFSDNNIIFKVAFQKSRTRKSRYVGAHREERLTVSHFSAMGEGNDGVGSTGAANECCGFEIGLQTNISLFRGVGGSSSVRACQLKVSFS